MYSQKKYEPMRVPTTQNIIILVGTYLIVTSIHSCYRYYYSGGNIHKLF